VKTTSGHICQDSRPTDQLTAARLQHEELAERLVQRHRDKIKIYPIPSRQHHLRGRNNDRLPTSCGGRMLPLSCALS
jgi:hypothetical protein